jgi:uncharacterized membrane protein (UPF0127 family)
MIDTDVLPLGIGGAEKFVYRSAIPELLVSPREYTDLNLLQPISVAIRDFLAERSEAKADIRMQVLNRTRQVAIASDIDVAKTSAQRRRGLLGRAGFPRGAGLWIAPCESVHTWGMRFSIDLIYLDRNYHVRKTRSDVRPWSISCCFSAHSVIELPAGTIRATGTREGDIVEFCCAVPVD